MPRRSGQSPPPSLVLPWPPPEPNLATPLPTCDEDGPRISHQPALHNLCILPTDVLPSHPPTAEYWLRRHLFPLRGLCPAKANRRDLVWCRRPELLGARPDVLCHKRGTGVLVSTRLSPTTSSREARTGRRMGWRGGDVCGGAWMEGCLFVGVGVDMGGSPLDNLTWITTRRGHQMSRLRVGERKLHIVT